MYLLKVMQKSQRNNITVLFFAIILVLAVPCRAQGPDAAFMAGSASLRSGDLRGAVDRFTQAIARNNADERLFIYRGRAYLRLKEYENALRDFNEANEIVPGIADIWLARAYALAGDGDQALSFLTSHLASNYRLPEDSIKKDPAFDNLQNSLGWSALWEKEWYNDQERAGGEVAYYIRKGIPDKAITVLDAEILKTPGEAGLLTMRGEVYYTTGNYAAAISDYSAAIELYKKGGTGYVPKEGLDKGQAEFAEGGLYALRGQAYLKATRYKDALNDLNRVVRENPAFFPAYLARAEANAGLKSYDASVRDVLTYLQYFNQDQHAIYLCGEYYYLAEDYINALKYFNRNLKEDPNSSLYYKSRGKAYLKAATYRYAISDLSMSLDLNPDDAETWMYFGLAKILSGDRENGCSDLEKARQLGSTEVVRVIVENCR